MADPRVDSRTEETVSKIMEELRKWVDFPDESNNVYEEEKIVKAIYLDEEKLEKMDKRREDKKKAKRRCLMGADYNADHTVCSSFIVDDDLLFSQILSRLPAKSLMRFKCVCKRWKSVIEHDSHFINLHHAHSESRPGFLIVVLSKARHRLDHTRDYESFLSAGLHCNGGGAKVHTVRKIESFSNLKILGPVRGLICLVDIHTVQIYNVSTGEVTPWVKSRVLANLEKKNVNNLSVLEHPECCFGFDPSTGKHKAIFLWYRGKFEEHPVCEVLTVGENTWRIIDDAPPCRFRHNGNVSAYANGSIYWFMYNGIPPWRGYDDYYCKVEYSESLMAFDIGSEKFRVIQIPKFTILEYTLASCYALLEMDGCLTMVRRRDHTVKMWKFHDYSKENGEDTTSSQKYWTEENIRLPSYITLQMRIYFHSVPGKNQLMLETYNNTSRWQGDLHGGFQRNVKCACFYSYDRITETFSKFNITGISFIPANCSTECATFVENLLPVQKKLQH